MKRTIAAVLILVLCLSLTACASDTEKAMEQARTLMDAGDYAGAKQVLTEDPAYQQVTAMLEEIRQKDSAFLVGNWISLDGRLRWEVREDGTVTTTLDDKFTEELDYSCQGRELTVGGVHWTVNEKDGVTVIGEPDMPMSMVRADDLDSLMETVELTMENWETYFEFREDLREPNTDEFGKINGIFIYSGFVLKDEYMDAYKSSDAAFEIHWDEDVEYCSTGWSPNNEGNLEYTLSDRIPRSDSAGSDTCTVEDKRIWELSEYSDLYQKVCAVVPTGDVFDETFANVKEGFTVTNVKGTLTLMK